MPIPEFKKFDVCILKGIWFDPMGWPIMLVSKTPYTHCLTFKSPTEVYDPNVGGIKLKDLINNYKKAKRGVTIIRYRFPYDEKKLTKWAEEKVASCKGYDYISWLGFITGLKYLEDEDRWFCSEFPYWLFQDNEYKLTDDDKTFIYPHELVENTNFEIIYEGKITDIPIV